MHRVGEQHSPDQQPLCGTANTTGSEPRPHSRFRSKR